LIPLFFASFRSLHGFMGVAWRLAHPPSTATTLCRAAHAVRMVRLVPMIRN
jgi:hypothetical protein